MHGIDQKVVEPGLIELGIVSFGVEGADLLVVSPQGQQDFPQFIPLVLRGLLGTGRILGYLGHVVENGRLDSIDLFVERLDVRLQIAEGAFQGFVVEITRENAGREGIVVDDEVFLEIAPRDPFPIGSQELF